MTGPRLRRTATKKKRPSGRFAYAAPLEPGYRLELEPVLPEVPLMPELLLEEGEPVAEVLELLGESLMVLPDAVPPELEGVLPALEPELPLMPEPLLELPDMPLPEVDGVDEPAPVVLSAEPPLAPEEVPVP